MRLVRRDRPGGPLGRRPIQEMVADFCDRRLVTQADARGADHADPGGRASPQLGQERLASHHAAGQAVADAHRQGRDGRLTLFHHVEMGVEGRDLVHLGKAQPHLLGERSEMGGRDLMVSVLDQVQVLDQEIASPRAIAQQGAHLRQSLRLDLTTFRRGARGPPSFPRVIEAADHRRTLPVHGAFPRSPFQPESRAFTRPAALSHHRSSLSTLTIRRPRDQQA